MTLTAVARDVSGPEQDSCEAGGGPTLQMLIVELFESVAAAQGKALSPLTDDLVLLDSGLDSLCFAIIVARLEDELGHDPFTEADEVCFPITFGEFVGFYARYC